MVGGAEWGLEMYPTVVFPLPGGPHSSVIFPRERPPPIALSSSSDPVLILESVA